MTEIFKTYIPGLLFAACPILYILYRILQEIKEHNRLKRQLIPRIHLLNRELQRSTRLAVWDFMATDVAAHFKMLDKIYKHLKEILR
jgi:hypothetical protein